MQVQSTAKKKKEKKKNWDHTTNPVLQTLHWLPDFFQTRRQSPSCWPSALWTELELERELLNLTGTQSTCEHLFSLMCSCNFLTSEQSGGRDKKNKKKIGRGFTFNFSCNCTSPGTSEHHTQPHISTAVSLLLPAFLMCSGHTASQAQDSSQYSSFEG